jgi:hypothetical protein
VTSSKNVIADDSQPVRMSPDSVRKIRDFAFPVNKGETYKVTLELIASDGKVLAHNTYVDAFELQPRPEGYPDRMDDEIGMRLWWAGEKP